MKSHLCGMRFGVEKSETIVSRICPRRAPGGMTMMAARPASIRWRRVKPPSWDGRRFTRETVGRKIEYVHDELRPTEDSSNSVVVFGDSRRPDRERETEIYRVVIAGMKRRKSTRILWKHSFNFEVGIFTTKISYVTSSRRHGLPIGFRQIFRYLFIVTSKTRDFNKNQAHVLKKWLFCSLIDMIRADKIYCITFHEYCSLDTILFTTTLFPIGV